MLLVDKPENCTSAHVVGVIKRKFGLKRVGHAGTLDPMATGLLILLCEQATKLQSFVVGEQKSYSGVIRLGIETDTDDITGQVIASNENKLVDSSKSRQEIIGELQNVFSGKINQIGRSHV